MATIPIWGDYYLDVATIDYRKPMERIVEKLEEEKKKCNEFFDFHKLQQCYKFEKVYEGRAKALKDAIEIVREEGGCYAGEKRIGKDHTDKNDV